MIDTDYVFVCTGNMCRSPFADYMFRKLGPQWVKTHSMGLAAFPGNSATQTSVRAARQFGVDLSSHRTRSLEEDVLQRAKAIYVFERMHQENMGHLFPGLSPKVHLLGSVIGAPDGEIPDPAGGPESGIVRCYEVIEKACRALIHQL